MRILHIHDFFAPGNSRLGYDICRLLVRLGHEVHVLAGVGRLGPEDGEVIEGVEFHTYPYGFGKGTLGFVRYSLSKNKEYFKRLQRRFDFNLLLFNQPLCFYGVIRLDLAKRIPKVYSFISPWAQEWRVENSCMDRANILQMINIYLRNFLEERALRDSQGIMVISRFMRKRLLENHPAIPLGKIHIIPCGVDTEFFSPGQEKDYYKRLFGLDSSCIVISTLRRLVKRMGVENLILAMKRIAPELGNVVLLIGGDGPLRRELKDLSKGIEADIRFLGYVEDRILPSFYRASDLFILPTKQLEGFGLVGIEAMSCETPVMGTPVGAIPEVLGGFSKEMIFEGCAPEDIAEGVIRFFKQMEKEELARKARRYVVENFAWERIIKRVESLFYKVAGGM
jgi:glycosyltransferase involved in cell wall biosynthesis